eukprot:COSAG03_NODE_277_length_9517_cov_112.780739_8_plen_140_part_00
MVALVGLVACCLSSAPAETALLRDPRTGAVVARVPVSHGAHGGIVSSNEDVDFADRATRLPPKQPHASHARRRQTRTWVPQNVSAEGQTSALKDVYMVPLLASEVFVVGEGGVVLKVRPSHFPLPCVCVCACVCVCVCM